MLNSDYCLSTHFTLEQLTATTYKVNNQTQSLAVVSNLRALATNVLEKLYTKYGSNLKISSAYRCHQLNNMVGGQARSQHLTGQAADFYVIGQSNYDIAKWIIDEQNQIPFDQLILENVIPGVRGSGWVHISYTEGSLRRKVNTKLRSSPTLQNGLIDPHDHKK